MGIDFIGQPTAVTAKQLLGKKLLIQQNGIYLGGYIVETEAYTGPEDMACHAYNWRRTPKVEALYAIGGTIYVYTMHGHHMLNLVCQAAGSPEGVLIRGLQPTDNAPIMFANRGKSNHEATNGPGKLTKAMGITRAYNGIPLNAGPVFLDEASGRIPHAIVASPRIGIPNKGEWTDKPLRFYVAGNPYVSLLPKRQLQPDDKTWKSCLLSQH